MLNPASKADKHLIHQCVCVCLLFSLDLNSERAQIPLLCKSIFLFRWPSTNPSWQGPRVCVHLCSAMFTYVSVRVHSLHVSWDPWWWIRAGTNALVHLWNENQGRGDRQRRAASHSHQASCRHNLTLYDGLMVHTHTHTLILYPPYSLFPFPFFFWDLCTKQTWQPHISVSRL